MTIQEALEHTTFLLTVGAKQSLINGHTQTAVRELVEAVENLTAVVARLQTHLGDHVKLLDIEEPE